MRQVVEQSDCLLMLGERLSDVSLGVSADLLRDRELITVVARDVFIKPNRYEHTSLERVVERLVAAPGLPEAADPISAIGADISPEVFDPFKQDESIKMRHVINLLNEFFGDHPDMPLVADTGDALFATVDIRANQCIAPAYYGTMGFSIPAALGVQLASGARAAGRWGVSNDRHGDRTCAAVPLQSHHRAAEQQPVGNAAGIFSARALQRDGELAVCETGRAVGRARDPGVHAAAASRRARGRARRISLHADRSGASEGRRLADPAGLCRGVQETRLRLVNAGITLASASIF